MAPAATHNTNTKTPTTPSSNAGVGKTVKLNSNTMDNTNTGKTPRRGLNPAIINSKFNSTNAALGSSAPRAFTMKPADWDPNSKPDPKSAPLQPKAATRPSASGNTETSRGVTTRGASRKQEAIQATSSSPTPSDNATDTTVDTTAETAVGAAASTSAEAKLAAFHEARGLTFEELYVGDDARQPRSSESEKVPQEPTTKVAKPSPKKTPSKKASPKSTKPTTSETPTKRTTRSSKRTSDNIDAANEADADADATPPAKRMKTTSDKSEVTDVTAQPLPVTSSKRPADDDNETSSPPSKRAKSNAGKKSTATAIAPEPRTPQKSAATNPRTRAIKTKAPAAPVITKNGKVKKTPERAVEHHFDGTPSKHGYSLECPQFGTLDTPWSCANLECSTGMTWAPRDHKDPETGKGPMGRKVISQYFGRNKGPTKIIPNDVWHYYCRKDYQRARYAAEHDTPAALAEQISQNLRDQLIRLQLWRPDAQFKVQLDKGASDRQNAYLALLRKHDNDEHAAEAALQAPKDAKKPKPEEVFPPALSEYFNTHFKSDTANYDDLEAIVTWAESRVLTGVSTVFAPVEFLINEPQTDETVNDVSDNFARWEVIHNRIRQENAQRAAAAAAGNNNAENTVEDEQKVKSEVSDDDAPAPVTPTPAPRKLQAATSSARTSPSQLLHADPSEPMNILRQLNDEAVARDFDARISP